MFGRPVEENRSKKARDEIAKRQAEIEKIMQADKVRIPPLTSDEKTELAACDKLIAKNQPTLEKLQKLLKERMDRQDKVNNFTELVLVEGADPDALVDEIYHLKRIVPELMELTRTLNSTINTYENKKRNIIENARIREARDGQ